MAGNHTAKLKASRISLQSLPFFDHTYATSSCGYTWGCFGRDAGGTDVVEGIGDSFVAECLSYPRNGAIEYAGLTYLVHGVCHQATNRIIDPAGLSLDSSVGGYRVSLLRFGRYGLSAWKNRYTCYKRNTSSPPARSSFAGGLRNQSKRPSALEQRQILDMPDSVDAAMQDMFGSTRDLWKDERVIGELREVVTRSLHAQEMLAHGFERNLIGPREFQDLAQSEHRACLIKIKTIIGESYFFEVFGSEGDAPELVADPEPFFKELSKVAP